MKHNQYAKKKILQCLYRVSIGANYFVSSNAFDTLKHYFAMYFNLIDGNQDRKHTLDALNDPLPMFGKAEMEARVNEWNKNMYGNQEVTMASEKQRKMIYAVTKTLGWSDEKRKEVMLKNFKTEHSEELTMKQATAFIDNRRANHERAKR